MGPIWNGGDKNEAALLASAYTESLRIAAENNLSSISFPSISTGAYRYPLEEAAEVAIKAIISFLKGGQSSLRQVAIVAFDTRTAVTYNAALRQNAEC